MKKLVLVCVMVCASQLYGMEPLYPKQSYMEAERISDLPKELQREITQTAIASSKDLDEAIAMIKKLSVAVTGNENKLFGNIKDFTKLVHILADHFNEYTLDIVFRFKTPVSEKYLNLFKELREASRSSSLDIDKIKQLINDGLDVNFTSPTNGGESLLMLMLDRNIEIIKLLLDAGANPYYTNEFGKTALDYAVYYATDETKKILEKAMKK